MHPSGDDLRTLAALVDAGHVQPVMDRTYPFANHRRQRRPPVRAGRRGRSCSGSCGRCCLRRPWPRRLQVSDLGRVAIALSATIAAVIALGLIYADDRAEWTGRAGTWTSLALMGGAAMAVAVFLGLRGRTLTLAAVLAVGAIAFASHYAINASSDTFDLSASAPNNRDLYHGGLDLVRLVNNSTTRGDWVPAFWYRSSADLMSIQSMYYFAYTYLGLDLPRVTAEVRDRLDQHPEPTRVVMLCKSRECDGGAPRPCDAPGTASTGKAARSSLVAPSGSGSSRSAPTGKALRERRQLFSVVIPVYKCASCSPRPSQPSGQRDRRDGVVLRARFCRRPRASGSGNS